MKGVNLHYIEKFIADGMLPLLQRSLHGLEKECLRIDGQGRISQNPHPRELGSKLTHPYISTDFSEAQLELVAPPFQNDEQLLQFMRKLHLYLYHHLNDEMLWPFSQPCHIAGEHDIPIAEFGSSWQGQQKELYRKGLSYRYGKAMQSLSGVHYNFSFDPEFWMYYQTLTKSPLPIGDLISESYLHIVRNYLRYGWLITYLFGISPIVDRSYFVNIPSDLDLFDDDSVYGKYACSLRMSEYGYYSKLQTQIRVCFNSFEEYVRDLELAVSTPAPQYQKIGVYVGGEWRQINDHIIQIEAEHYSRIRPKPPLNKQLRPLDGLRKEGIHYVEVRGMDLNPWSDIGIDQEHIRFLQVFLLYCLLSESQPLAVWEEKELIQNQNAVALYGRSPDLTLKFQKKTKFLQEWGQSILDMMLPVARLLDKSFATDDFSQAVLKQNALIKDGSQTPSAQLLKILQEKKQSFSDYGLELANKYQEEAMKKKTPKAFERKLQKISEVSIKEQEEMELYDDFILHGYEDLELSTQAVLREAQKRGVIVEELDRNDHIFRLKRDGHAEMIKKATMTCHDSLMTYLLMENKHVSKKILQEQDISVPQGELFYSKEEALHAYERYAAKKMVVKPNKTNYGIDVFIVNPFDKEAYHYAVVHAFRRNEEVVIEQFYEGEEYRFLIIRGQCEAICSRIPANVVGDGIHTIKQLIKRKNYDIRSYKVPKYHIRAGVEEERNLEEQSLTFQSILPKGTRVFLRKNSNVSTGGDSINVQDKVHSSYAEIAIQSAEAVQAVFCGVDMMIKDISKPATSDNYAIIELNYNPALWIHRYPTQGEKTYVEKAVLDTLGFKEES